MSELICRKAEKGDMKELKTLYTLVSGENPGGELEREEYFVGTQDGKLIALGCLDDYGKTDYKEGESIDCNSYVLCNFGVHPNYRKQGVGRKLMEHIYNSLEYYKGVARVEFLIAEGSFPFWEKATINMNTTLEGLCENIGKKECKCEQCKTGLDIYNLNPFGLEECSHFCIMIKNQPKEEQEEQLATGLSGCNVQ